MQTCPRCGHDNPDAATLCEHCHEALSAPNSAGQTTTETPMEEPPEAPPERVPVSPSGGRPAKDSRPPVDPIAPSRPSFWTENGPYLWGLGLGLIPAILWFLAAGAAAQASSGGFLVQGAMVYGVELVVMIICLVSKSSRLFGFGLLTMMLIAPVVGAVACVRIVSSL